MLATSVLFSAACTVQVEGSANDGSAADDCEATLSRFADLLDEELAEPSAVRSIAEDAAACSDPAKVVDDFSFGPHRLSDDAASCLTSELAGDLSTFLAALYFLSKEVPVPDREFPVVADALTTCVEGSFVLRHLDERFEDIPVEAEPCLDDAYRSGEAHRPFFERTLSQQRLNTLQWTQANQFAFYAPIYECLDMTTFLWGTEVSEGFSEPARVCVNGVAADYWYLVLERSEDENLGFFADLESCLSAEELQLVVDSL